MKTKIPEKKLALVYDDLVQKGGGEKFFLNIVKLYPNAVIYVPIVSNEYLQVLNQKNLNYSNFLSQLLIFGKFGYKVASLLSIIWFESLDLNRFNTVISLCNRFSGVVVTSATTKHVVIYTHPARILFKDRSLNFLTGFLRVYLFYSSKRADINVAISAFISTRLKKLINIESIVLHPFVNFNETLCMKELPNLDLGEYFLIVGRCNKWKARYFKKAVDSVYREKKKVVLVGSDFVENKLFLKYKDNPFVIFKGYVTEAELASLYTNCIALIHPQVEDFGLTPLECLYFGKPVIAYKSGGVQEFLSCKVCLYYSNKSEFIKNINNVGKFKLDLKERDKIIALHSPKYYKQQLDLKIKSI